MNETYRVRDICPFPVVFHDEGSFAVKLFYGADGRLERELDNSAGYFLETYTANGVTLQSAAVSYSFKIGYAPY